MALSGTNSQAVAAPEPLPLFRPEALAAQEKMHGDVLRIRPLPLAFFPRLGAALIAVSLAYLFAGRYTEKVLVTGVLAPGASDQASLFSNRQPQAFLVVPERWIGKFRQGATVELRCPGCADPGHKLAAEVVEISQPSGPNAAAYKVILTLPSNASNFLRHTSSPQSSTRLEAEIPLGRRPLMYWLMEHSEH